MADGHHGAVEFAQVFLQPLRGLQIQMVGRLVQQQDIGVLQDQPPQIYPGLFAAGQLVKQLLPHVGADGQTVGHLILGGAGVVSSQRLKAGRQFTVPPQQDVVTFPLGHPGGEIIHFRLQRLHPFKGGIQHVLHHEAGGVDGDLGDQSHPPSGGNEDLAAVRFQFAGQQTEQGGLSRAVFPQQTHPFAGIDLEGDAVQYFLFQIEGLYNVLHRDIYHIIACLLPDPLRCQ